MIVSAILLIIVCVAAVDAAIMDGKQRKLNQFGDFEDVSHKTVDDWDHRWSSDQTKFHMPIVHPMLRKHIQKLTLQRNRQNFFVPPCGKSLDLKWLSDQGHDVVGNEGADAACKQFYEENKIPYTTGSLIGVEGVLYKATDGKSIKIYGCDWFDLSSKLCGKFDCIWDRGGFVALPVTERKRYGNVIQSLVEPDCRYLLDCFLVDNTRFGERFCGVQKIDTKDAFTKWQEAFGITSLIEEVYLLKPKQHFQR